MTSDERKAKIEEISQISDGLHDLARHFERLKWLAEREAATEAFINLADAAGKMTKSSLSQLSTLLDLLYRSQLGDEAG